MEAFTHSDVLVSRVRVLEVIPSTGDEHNPNHDAQKKKRDISELSQLGKHRAVMIAISIL
jgi:hypothetical protein